MHYEFCSLLLLLALNETYLKVPSFSLLLLTWRAAQAGYSRSHINGMTPFFFMAHESPEIHYFILCVLSADVNAPQWTEHGNIPRSRRLVENWKTCPERNISSWLPKNWAQIWKRNILFIFYFLSRVKLCSFNDSVKNECFDKNSIKGRVLNVVLCTMNLHIA